MLPVIAIFVWGAFCTLLCKSSRKLLRYLGGALGFAGALVCSALLFHII